MGADPPAGGEGGSPGGAPCVLLIRPDGNQADASALVSVGLQPWIDPYLEVRPVADPTGPLELLQAIIELGAPKEQRHAVVGVNGGPGRPGSAWLVVASPRAYPCWESACGAQELQSALRHAAAAGVRAAAVGRASAASLPDVGWPPVLLPGEPTAAGLVRALAREPAGFAVVPRSAIAREELALGLAELRWQVLARAVYDTIATAVVPASAQAVRSGRVAAVVLRSPSAARALFAHVQPPEQTLLVAAGPTTARAVVGLGGVPLVCESTDPTAVASLVASTLRGG